MDYHLLPPYRNEPPLDFTIAEVRDSVEKALTQFRATLQQGPRTVSPCIDGSWITTERSFSREDPSDTSRTVCTVMVANTTHVVKALESLHRGQLSWSSRSVEDRAAILERAAQLMRDKRLELIATIVYEAGKPWREADGDVTEAIDFCTYYAREVLKLVPQRTMDVAGEENWYRYEPRGITAVIAPWNFPFAIACGMTVAALVTGNTVALKPAEQTSLIAQCLASILYEAGVPSNALAFLPGYGAEVGQALVDAAEVHTIVFTGSRAVGEEILKRTAVRTAGQYHIKRVILELGGKNPIIIDEDADLDEAIKGVLYSAFGFAGQKCSACSRVIVIGDAYETFLKRLKEAARALFVGPAAASNTLIGPVIDEESFTRLTAVSRVAAQYGTILYQGPSVAGGHFVPPLIVRDVQHDSPLWRDEQFGPLLAVTKAHDLDQAFAYANSSEYALTGGIFSRSPRSIERAKRELIVGNLYINRGCTGALVCRQPFGGFKMSGVGSKAGGPDYLLQFVEPRAWTENTMRRGFTPESS
jgi:RHH-type proline utilization regulon transcriptional repressor/proline dehydrogenase/delta 1-pyrroline-5-carboxylate dehydrogenase